MIVVVAVRFVNEKRARNEQRKERREGTNANAGGRTAAGLPGWGPRGQGRRPSVRWRERESSRDAELVRVPLLIILIARSKVARGDGGEGGGGQ